MDYATHQLGIAHQSKNAQTSLTLGDFTQGQKSNRESFIGKGNSCILSHRTLFLVAQKEFW